MTAYGLYDVLQNMQADPDFQDATKRPDLLKAFHPTATPP